MSDITTNWNATAIRGDWSIAEGDLVSGNDLQTAVIISLFTDRVANPGDVIPDGSNDPRGWWGDVQIDGSLSPIGSRIWLLSREKQTQDTLNRAVTYAKEALAWMLTDGVAADIDVIGNWNAPGFLALKVTIYKQDGTFIALNFNWAWSQT
jgi:phage gp46-like protein